MISRILDLLIFSCICILIAVRIGIRILDITSSRTAAIISIDLRISCCFTSSSVTFICIPCRILNITSGCAIVSSVIYAGIWIFHGSVSRSVSFACICVRILYASIRSIAFRILYISFNGSIFPACILIRVLYFAACCAVSTCAGTTSCSCAI